MSKVFVFDFKYCNGCYNCQIACKDEHCEQSWLPYSEAQPLTGQFWCKVNETVRGQVPVVKVSYEPTLCNHCADAPCMAAAIAAGKPEAVYRREDGLIIIDLNKAQCLSVLVDSCPIGAIYYNAELDIPQKCTGCAHLIDNGWSVPRCVDACPTEALLYVEESEIDLTKAEIKEETRGLGPRMYYLNRPKRFIAGCVIDEIKDEVVIGATVDLIDANGDTIASANTDDFGDFKFDQIEEGRYTVSVGGKRVAADVTEQDLTLGDIDISA